jgi:hypothetical protein
LDWRSVWTIVTSSDEDTEQLRISLQLCGETLSNWRNRYQKIVTWGFKRQGQRRNEQACLARPIGAPALSVVEWMWIRRRSAEITALRRVLVRTFLSNFNGEGFYSRMPTAEDAEEFAAFLRAVGIDGRSITIARGRVSDFKDLKSGKITARNVLDGDTVLFKKWDASKACRRKPPNDSRSAVWVSYIKYEDASLGKSYQATRTTEKFDPPEKGRRFAQHKVNYAYRFGLAMMAIVDDDIWPDSGEPTCTSN